MLSTNLLGGLKSVSQSHIEQTLIRSIVDFITLIDVCYIFPQVIKR